MSACHLYSLFTNEFTANDTRSKAHSNLVPLADEQSGTRRDCVFRTVAGMGAADIRGGGNGLFVVGIDESSVPASL